MTTQQIADRLVELCRKGQIMEAQTELFADDVISIEPEHTSTPTARGKSDVYAKGKAFAASIKEHHGGSISNAVVGGRFFSLAMMVDATFEGRGRMKLEEICLYEVKDGKIISEEFCY